MKDVQGKKGYSVVSLETNSFSTEKMSGTQLLAKPVENAHWQNDTRLTEETNPFLGYPKCFGREMQ